MLLSLLWNTYDVSLKPWKPYFSSIFGFKNYRLSLEVILQIGPHNYFSQTVHNEIRTSSVAFHTFTDRCTSMYTSIYLLHTSIKENRKKTIKGMLKACGGIHFNIKPIILCMKYNTCSYLSDTAIEIKYHYNRILRYWRHYSNTHTDYSKTE